MTDHLLTLAISFASAVVPVVNLEAYLGGLTALGRRATLWSTMSVGAMAATGQMAGKSMFYLAGRGVIRLPQRLHRHAKVGAVHGAGPHAVDQSSRPVARLARWRGRMEGRPTAAVGVVTLSAFAGVPPFAIISALAGVVRVPFSFFVIAGLVGRWMRFLVVLGLVGSLAN